MGNTSVTTFEFRTENAERNLNDLIGRVEKFDSMTSNLGKSISLGGNVPQLANEVNNLSNSLDKLSKPSLTSNLGKDFDSFFKQVQKFDNLGNSLNPLQSSAIKLKGEITSLRSQISSLNASASATKSQNSIFNKFENEAEKLNKQLTLTELKLKQLDGIRGKQTVSTPSKFDTLKGIGVEAIGSKLNDLGAPAELTNAIQAKATAALSAISASSIAVFGGLAVAGVAIVKYSESVRAEAEKRLKIEESLAVAQNKQILAGQEITENYRKQSEFAKQTFEFNRYLQSNNNLDSLKSLTQRKNTLEELGRLNSFGDKTKSTQQRDEAFRIGEQIRTLQEIEKNRPTQSADNAMRLRFDGFVKQQDYEIQRRLDAQKKFNESVDLGKKRVDDLGKTYFDVFDGISSRLNTDNGFVKFFSDSDKSLNTLRENTKGLGSDLQQMAFNMEKQINQTNLFSLRLNSNLSAFDLKSEAERFRNARNPLADKEQFEAIVNRNINGLGSNSTGELYRKSFGSDLASRFGANNLTDAQKRQIYEVSLLTGSTSGVNQDSLISAFARSRLSGNQDLSVQDRLEKQFDIVRNLGASSDAQKAIADRKIIELTSGLNPSDLSQSQRDFAAQVREREAERRLNAENEAKKQRQEDLEIQKQIRDELKKFNSIAEKDGIKAILEIIDKTNGSISVREGRALTANDTANQYE